MAGIDYLDTWQETMRSPSYFFKEMPKTGELINPIIFAGTSICIGFLIRFIFTAGCDFKNFDLLMGFLFVFIVPVLGVIIRLIEAILLHIVFKLIGGTGTYEGTMRFVLYSCAASSLCWIPFIGWLFEIYQIYLYIVGGKFVHNISMEKSALAVFLYISFFVVLGIIGYFLIHT